jgi:hypothetical protein
MLFSAQKRSRGEVSLGDAFLQMKWYVVMLFHSELTLRVVQGLGKTKWTGEFSYSYKGKPEANTAE